MIGNAMDATVLVAQRAVDEFRDKRLEVGGVSPLALRLATLPIPNLVTALRAALVPRSRPPRRSGSCSCPPR
jgi:hypothetical protein